MTAKLLGVSPFANFGRWLLASITNTIHLVDWAGSTAAAPLPESVKHVTAPATMQVWGQVFDATGELIAAAASQVTETFATHPILASLETAALLWLMIESVLLAQTAFRWVKSWRLWSSENPAAADAAQP